MDRRLVCAVFAAATATSAACGHQVTPDVSGASNLAGRMLIRFRTTGAMDFARYDYVIVVNTCATGQSDTPLPNVYNSTFLNYSYAFAVGASSGGVSTTSPYLLQYVFTQDATNPLGPQRVPLNPSQTTLTLNDDGTNDEFELVFDRSLLDDPLRIAQPCPNVPAGASPVSSARSATGAAATQAASPTGTPTPPTAVGTPYESPVWYFNFFVLDHASRQPLDSLGIGGPTDTTYNAPPIDTTLTLPHQITREPDLSPPSATAAQIVGGEIDNVR